MKKLIGILKKVNIISSGSGAVVFFLPNGVIMMKKEVVANNTF